MPASVSAPRAATAFSASARRRSGSAGDGRVEHLLRDHALGQVVEPLEALPAGDHEVAVVPEPVEHRLRRLPVPHPSLARALEVPRAERPARADLRQDLLGEVGVRLADVAVPPSAAVLASARRRAATPRPAAGRPRGPSTRTRARRRAAASTVPRRGRRRRGRSSAIRWLRSTAEIESSWTHESRRIVSSTSRVVPVRERTRTPGRRSRGGAARDEMVARAFSRAAAVGETAGDAPRASRRRWACIERAGIRSRPRPRRRARVPEPRTAQRPRDPRRRCRTT